MTAPLSGATDTAARRYDPSRPIKVLSWNVQFCASTQTHFFYEGGSCTSVPSKQLVLDTITTLAEVITQHDPDVVLLQARLPAHFSWNHVVRPTGKRMRT